MINNQHFLTTSNCSFPYFFFYYFECLQCSLNYYRSTFTLILFVLLVLMKRVGLGSPAVQLKLNFVIKRMGQYGRRVGMRTIPVKQRVQQRGRGGSSGDSELVVLPGRRKKQRQQSAASAVRQMLSSFLYTPVVPQQHLPLT